MKWAKEQTGVDSNDECLVLFCSTYFGLCLVGATIFYWNLKMKMDLVCMYANHACLSEKYWWRSCRTLHVKHREVLPHTFGYIS
jgi:hypothetical protein